MSPTGLTTARFANRVAATAALMVAMCALAPALFGQNRELGFQVGYPRYSKALLGSPIASQPKDDDTRIRGQRAYGVRFTFNTPGYYGHEFGYMLQSAQLQTNVLDANSVRVGREDRIAIHQAFYNFLMYFMPSGEKWRPFITGGLQAQQFGAPSIAEWDAGRSRKYGVNYGGGIKLLPHKNVIFRLDVRDYVNGKPYRLHFEQPKGTGLGLRDRSGGFLRQLELSAGFSIGF